MFKRIAILALLASTTAHAISYEVIGPCSETPVYSGEINLSDLKASVGKISLQIFERDKISFNGTEAGFKSILNTPTGMDSIEVISQTKMRAHGWCYTVNKLAPDVLPSDYFFNSNNDSLVWFYGHSTYENGAWTDYCVPSHQVHAAQFCAK